MSPKNNSSLLLPSSSPTRSKIQYPYKVDYNDHFETPLIAYKDILPILDVVAPTPPITKETGKRKKKKRRRKQVDRTSSDNASTDTNDNSNNNNNNRKDHVIYDPYYCNGRTKRLLNEFGFTNVQHEKRDFYKDVKENTIPPFHTLITNPPYSGDHKEKCMQFAIQQLRGRGDDDDDNDNDDDDCGAKSFFILMPNYVACRNHFRLAIMNNTVNKSHQSGYGNTHGKEPLDIMYVIPSIPYEYEHPEGTGKDLPPFASIWFCGIPIDKVDAVKEAFRQTYGIDSVGIPTISGGRTIQNGLSGSSSSSSSSSSPRLVTSLHELNQLNAVPTIKRPNPRQRRKARMAQANKYNNNNNNNDNNNDNNTNINTSTNRSNNTTEASKKNNQNKNKGKVGKKRKRY